MADRVKGIIIEMGADTTQLTKALSGVNSSLKSTQGELNDVNRLLKMDPTNTELLSQKQRLLSQQSEDAAKKLDILKSAQTQLQQKLSTGADATEEERRQMERLQREIIATSGKMDNLSDETAKTNEALKDGGEKTSALSGAMESLSSRLSDRLPTGLQGFVEKLNGANKSAVALAGTVTLVIGALGKMTLSTAETAKEIDIMSQRMGMNTEEYQQWDYVLKRFGTSAEEAQGDLSALAEKAKDAAEGSGEAAELFKELGIRVKNNRGELKGQSELFEQTVSALQRMTNETKRNAIASALLSTTGENLIPVLNMTKEELAGLKQEAQETGAVMTDGTIDKFQKLNDSMAKFTQTTDTVKNNLAVVLLPILTKLFEVIAAIPAPVLQTVVVIGSVVTTIILAVKAMKEAAGAAKSVKDGIEFIKDGIDGLNPKMLKTIAIIAGVATALIAILALIAAIKGENIKRTFSDIGEGMGEMSSVIQGNTPRYASGTQYHRGGWALVGEQGAELVDLPQGSRVLTASQTRSALSGGDVFNISINAGSLREFNDIIRMAETARQQRRAK